MPKFFISIEEKERLFHAELVKVGVDYQQAARVAKLLAQNIAEEDLTSEEAQLSETACRIWLQHRQRLSFVERTLATFSAKTTQRLESNCRDCAGFNSSSG
jgi:hypothetical protein